MRTISLLIVITTLVVVALVTPGCSDSSGESTTTADSGASASIVVFGRGTVPEVVPDSFPIPDEAVIGATMVDPNRGLTEMIITLPASVDSVVTYYEGNLPLSGYEFTSSEGTGGEWLMEFNGEGADGEIRIKAGGSGVSTATVRLTRS